MLISFSGALPLGNLNITALLIASKETWRKAFWFAAGVTMVEVIYLRVTLSALHFVIRERSVFLTLQWITVFFLLLYAAASFWALQKRSHTVKNVVVENKVHRFILGAGMSAINPIQFPFWAAWGIYALTQQWLLQEARSFNLFTAGAGAGTILGLFIFILAGKKLSFFLQKHQYAVQMLTGCLFVCLAVLQTAALLKN